MAGERGDEELFRAMLLLRRHAATATAMPREGQHIIKVVGNESEDILHIFTLDFDGILTVLLIYNFTRLVLLCKFISILYSNIMSKIHKGVYLQNTII